MNYKQSYKKFFVEAYDRFGLQPFTFSQVRFAGINSGTLHHLKDTGLLLTVGSRAARSPTVYRLSERVPEYIVKFRWREYL